MASIRLRIGMSDVILLIGPRPARARQARRLARDPTPVERGYSPRLVSPERLDCDG